MRHFAFKLYLQKNLTVFTKKFPPISSLVRNGVAGGLINMKVPRHLRWYLTTPISSSLSWFEIYKT